MIPAGSLWPSGSFGSEGLPGPSRVGGGLRKPVLETGFPQCSLSRLGSLGPLGPMGLRGSLGPLMLAGSAETSFGNWFPAVLSELPGLAWPSGPYVSEGLPGPSRVGGGLRKPVLETGFPRCSLSPMGSPGSPGPLGRGAPWALSCWRNWFPAVLSEPPGLAGPSGFSGSEGLPGPSRVGRGLRKPVLETGFPRCSLSPLGSLGPVGPLGLRGSLGPLVLAVGGGLRKPVLETGFPQGSLSRLGSLGPLGPMGLRGSLGPLVLVGVCRNPGNACQTVK